MFGSYLYAADPPVVAVEVVPLTHAVAADELFQVAVIFSMEPDWHIYWQNPGEAGMPTNFNWSLPNNFKLLSQQEPTPKRHVDGGITTFVHEKEAIYLFTLLAPAEMADTNFFALDIEWLECRDICQAGSFRHQFVLKRSTSPTPEKKAWRSLRIRAEKRFPQTMPLSAGQLVHRNNQLELVFKRPPHSEKLLGAEFFPFEEMLYDPGGSLEIKRGLFKERIIFPPFTEPGNFPKTLAGVLVMTRNSPDGPVITRSIINQVVQ